MENNEQKAASFIVWGVKNVTNLPSVPSLISSEKEIFANFTIIFTTRKDAREWIKKNKCGYSWKPV